MSECGGRKFSFCRLIGLMGAMFILFGAITVGTRASLFVNLPSFAIIFGITFFLLLATFGMDFLKFIPDALLTLVCNSNNPNKRFAEIAVFASRYIVGAGLIGAIIGLIRMLGSLSDPSSIGIGMATALLTPFYAIVASEIFFAYLYKAYSDGHKMEENKPLSIRTITVPSMVIALMLITFFALLHTFTIRS